MMSYKESTIAQDEWDLTIRAKRDWWDLRLGELWRYRDLIRLFVWRDFVAVYKQTILGPLWHIIPPIISSGVFTIIFGNVAKLSTDGLPPFIFYLAGTTVWNYFSACFMGTSNTFTSNAHIFGKVYFPRLSVPISVIISNLIAFGIRLGLFLMFLLYFIATGAAIQPNLWVLMLPVLLLIMAGMGLGTGIIISSMTTKYRDLQHLVGFGVQLLMFLSPVVYPLSTAEGAWRWVILANPLTPIIEIFRFAFLGTSTVDPLSIYYSVGFMFVVLIIGLIVFYRVETTFMDTV